MAGSIGILAEGMPKPHSELLEKQRKKTAEPDRYQVVLQNDDFTTMDFVVALLEQVFDKPPAEAYRIMMAIHQQGRGICGVYPYEIAETKVAEVHGLARANDFPLLATLERA